MRAPPGGVSIYVFVGTAGGADQNPRNPHTYIGDDVVLID